MARPMREKLMKFKRKMNSGTVTNRASRSPWVIGTPRIVAIVVWDSIRSGTPRCAPPSQSRPTFCRMNEKPTAVISGASLGALRNGL